MKLAWARVVLALAIMATVSRCWCGADGPPRPPVPAERAQQHPGDSDANRPQPQPGDPDTNRPD